MSAPEVPALSAPGPAPEVLTSGAPAPAPEPAAAPDAPAPGASARAPVVPVLARAASGVNPTPAVPLVELRYRDLCYSVKLGAQQQQERGALPSVLGTLLSIATFVPRHVLTLGAPAAAPPRDFFILDHVSGVIRPGTMTLVLAPPGHGKSAFLKALTQSLPAGAVSGTITYSGVTAAAAPARGVYLGALCQYVNQVDEHLPQLTVRETFDFIRANAAVDPSEHGFPHLKSAHADAVEDILQLLSLKNCEGTMIGDNLERGVSGGEKKRVTVGEGLLTNARALALDEISTGLDSAVTFDICKRLRERASNQGLCVVTSLLQPTPETFGLFDDIILMREGAVVYHGSRAELPSYLTALGFTPPTLEDAAAALVSDVSGSSLIVSLASSHASDAAALPGGHAGLGSGAEVRGKDALSHDLADWLLQLLSDPAKVVATTAAAATASPTHNHKGDHGAAAAVPTTTAALAAAWSASLQFKSMMSAPPSAPPLALEGSFAVQQYSRPYAHSFLHHQRLLLHRQLILVSRNLLYLRSRLMSACIMSVILGGLYYQRSTPEAATYMGAFLNVLMIIGFANLSEMAAAVENKFVAYRQVANGAYPGTAYVAASAITHVPVAIVESLIFTSVIYGMSGMGDQGNVGAYFFVWGIVVLFDLVMRNLLVTFALRGRTLLASQAAPLPVIAGMIIFGGFLVTQDKLGWLDFVYWINPMAWGVHAMALNEFLLPRYDGVAGPGISSSIGQYFLSAFGLDSNPDYRWGGFVFIACFLVLVLLAEFISFSSVRYDRNIGSARKQALAPGPNEALAHAAMVTDSASAVRTASTATATTGTEAVAVPVAAGRGLAFTPMTVTFKDLFYTVQLPRHQGGGQKVLLNGITGYAKPGRLLALMGASGSGKTTLLDVLAGRKNSGFMIGAITLNGFPKEERSFNRVTAYVEQMDLHMPLTTVRESLEFSAKLRLPADATAEERARQVSEIMTLLELDDLQDRLVGDVGAPDGLAPHERKRLTIGVELVGNASVLFLDEPTSGLDARAAAIVMRVVRNVALTGRTVICTIHQPSSELFFFFDDLLLLQRGGWEVFFGELGQHSANLVRYLPQLPGVLPCPAGMNPASWMLDSLQGFNSSPGAAAARAALKLRTGSPAGKPEYAEKGPPPAGEAAHAHFFERALGLECLRTVAVESVPRAGQQRVEFASVHARSLATQVGALVQRGQLSYSRNLPLNLGRIAALTLLNLLFGTIWFGIARNATDASGVQSLVSCIFMSAAFGGMLSMALLVPALLGLRSVFYREQASAMYAPLAYQVAAVLVELPWLFGVTLGTTAIGYFMFGLVPAAFGFHLLVCFVLATVFVSVGMCLAAFAPTFEVAEAILGVVQPLFILFGGLFSPAPSMAIGARWFCYIDPITYAFKALIPEQVFVGSGEPGAASVILSGPTPRCGHTPPGFAGPCTPDGSVAPGGAVILDGATVFYLDRYAYVSQKYDVWFDQEWQSLGYLAVFVVVLQCVAFLGVRYVKHIVR